MITTVLDITVAGVCQPAGSKTAIVRISKTGKPFASVVEANKKSPSWKNAVSATAAAAWGNRPLLTGPVVMIVEVRKVRTANHYGSGKNSHLLKEAAPQWPTSKPDTTKLVRGTEDALKDVVWRDDSAVIFQLCGKVFAETASTRIVIGTIPETVGEWHGVTEEAWAASVCDWYQKVTRPRSSGPVADQVAGLLRPAALEGSGTASVGNE